MLTGSAPFCPPPPHPHRDSLCWKEMGIFFPSEFPSLADSSVAAESLRGARGGLRGGRQKAGPERPCPAPPGSLRGSPNAALRTPYPSHLPNVERFQFPYKLLGAERRPVL